MSDKKKKIAAAIAAILDFEAEGSALQPAAVPAYSPAPPLPLWSMAGRQENQAMRVLLQRRMGR